VLYRADAGHAPRTPEVAHAELHNSHLLLELRGESKMGPLVSLLVHAGAEIEEVRRGKVSLE